MKANTAEAIQSQALKGLQADFVKAANEKRKDLTASFQGALEDPVHENVQRNDRAPWGKRKVFDKWDSDFQKLKFLHEGATGGYATPEFSSMDGYNNIWNDYLRDIGRLHSGFGCYPRNDGVVEKLIKQNGPKKMEQRLTGFLKRRIKQVMR